MARWTAKSVGYLANQLSQARSSVDEGTAVPFSCDKLSVDAPKLNRAERAALRCSLPPPKRQGKAVFLLGAGCSRSAGIPVAADVARYAAIYLQEVYSHDPGDTLPLVALADHVGCWEEFQKKAAAALHWLDDKGKVPDFEIDLDNPDWGRLYVYFFENDLASPNRQREFLSELISRAGGKLNWAHACLGELVHKGYVGTVMTTNFDQLAFQAVTRAGTLPVIADLEDLTRVVAEPTEPQIIYLHGSMHTYSLRNSRVSVRQTDEHEVLPAVLYKLLHRSDLLVVVGYAGGEEGVMQLLKRIARQLPSLMIFWVLYESDEGALSSGAVSLLSIGENKFLLSDTGADEFFRDLMNELGLGVPDWIEDPFARLVRDAARIDDMRDEDVKSSILRMQALVEAARREAEAPTPAQTAGLARLKGNYRDALDALVEAGDGVDATLNRAATRYKLAQATKNKEEATTALGQIIAELDGILATSLSEEQRAQGLELRVQALTMLRDRDDNPNLNEDIVKSADSALALSVVRGNERQRVQFQISRAHALLEMSERNEGDQSAELDEATQAFKAALTVLEHSSNAQLVEAKEGLAGSLERQAKAKEGEERRGLLKQAVAEYLELLVISEAHSQPKGHASLCENAAHATKELAKTYEGSRRFSLMRQADDLIGRAEAIYRREGASAAEQLARVQGARHRPD